MNLRMTNISSPVTMRSSDYALFRTNIASALGHISQLFLAFVPNLFVVCANWANVLLGLGAFMGTAQGDINSHCSCKTARFAQAEVHAGPQQVQSEASCLRTVKRRPRFEVALRIPFENKRVEVVSLILK